MSFNNGVNFLKWALQRQGYKWAGFRKPQNQVIKRVKNRMQELELEGGFSEYKEYLKRNPKEWDVFDAMCDVTISRFFRDRNVWEFLKSEGIPEIVEKADSDRVRVWSAGCCNGEEAYSIAILVDMVCNENELERVEILASDRNDDVLDRAAAGKYTSGSLKEMNKQEIEAYFLKDSHSGEFQIIDRVKDRVTFEKRDIQNSLPQGMFDMVFCRNLVFTYYSIQQQVQFLDRVSSIIKKDGMLIIGDGETIPNHTTFDKAHPKLPLYKKTGEEI